MSLKVEDLEFKSRNLEFQSRDLKFQSRDLEFQSRDLEFKDYYGMILIELRRQELPKQTTLKTFVFVSIVGMTLG